MSLATKERDREQARDECIKHGAPNLGVDHSAHWKKIPYETLKEPDKEIE